MFDVQTKIDRLFLIFIGSVAHRDGIIIKAEIKNVYSARRIIRDYSISLLNFVKCRVFQIIIVKIRLKKKRLEKQIKNENALKSDPTTDCRRRNVYRRVLGAQK